MQQDKMARFMPLIIGGTIVVAFVAGVVVLVKLLNRSSPPSVSQSPVVNVHDAGAQ
jgi:hypothetical protein